MVTSGALSRTHCRLLLFFAAVFAAVTTAYAGTYKLYINADQNAGNVITFDDSLTASVKHTSKGIELFLPGVEVALRCKSNSTSSTTDSCVIAVEAAAVTSTSTSTSSSGSTDTSSTSSASTTTSSGTSSGNCTTQGTWSNCDSGSSSGSTNTDTSNTDTTTTTTTTPTTTTSAGSSSCSSTGTVLCRKEDIGSGGSYATGNRILVTMDPGQVVAFPFSVSPGRYIGSIQRARTSSEVGTGQPRVWFSVKPNGEAICAAVQPASYYGSTSWSQTSAYTTADCNLGNTAGTYYVNFAICDAPSSDMTCQSSSAKPSNQTNTLYIAPSRKTI